MAVLEHAAAFDLLAIAIQHAAATLKADHSRAPVLLKSTGENFSRAACRFVDQDYNRALVNLVTSPCAQASEKRRLARPIDKFSEGYFVRKKIVSDFQTHVFDIAATNA